MPTYSQNLPLIPTEYVPIDYRHDAQFELAEAQQAATNIAQVKSRYEDLLGMELTNDKSKEALSSFMKGAEEDLRKVSGMDMMVGSNATQALSILKPLTQLDGPYGYIVVDNVFTKKIKSQKSIASQQKVNPKDNNYNAAADELLDIMQARFRNTTNVEDWKYLLNSVEDYTPYYDTNKEDRELMDKFKPDEFESETSDGQGRIINSKNSSAYAAQIQSYLDANHSDAYKRQKGLESKVQFGRIQLNAYDANTKTYNASSVYNHFNSILDGIKKSQVDVYTNEKLNLERQSALLPKTAEGLKEYKAISDRISILNQNIKSTQDQTIDKDSFMNPVNYKQAEAIATNLLGIQESVKKAQSLEHLHLSTTMKEDAAYWANLRQNLEEKKFEYQKENDAKNRELEMNKLFITAGLKKLTKDGKFVNDDGFNNAQNKALVTNQKSSIKEQAEDMLTQVQSAINGELQVGTNGYLKYVDKVFGVNFSTAVKTLQDADKKNKLAGKTWGDIIQNNIYHDLGNKGLNDYALATYKKVYKKPNATIADIQKMEYNDVLNLVIGGIKSPADQLVLTKSLSGRDKAEAQAIISQAKSVTESLRLKIKQATKGSIYEDADLDLSRISDKNYMSDAVYRIQQKEIGKFKGKTVNYSPDDWAGKINNFFGWDNNMKAVITDIRESNGRWVVYGNVGNSKNIELGDMDKVLPGQRNKKYLFSYRDPGESGDMLKNRTDPFYRNVLADRSSFQDLHKEQISKVPVLYTAGTSPDKETRDEWHAYDNRNLDLIRSSDNPEKPVYDLVQMFPGAFIAHKDENGITFALNRDYVNIQMTEDQRNQLFKKIDEKAGRNHWYTSDADNVDQAMDQINEIVEKDPGAFTVNIPGMDLQSFKNDKQSKYLYAGGKLSLDPIIPQSYTDASGKSLPIEKISLQVQNLAANTPDEANPSFSGQMLLPLFDNNTGTFKRDKSGNLLYNMIGSNELNSLYTVDQKMANSSGVMKELAIYANAYADIIDVLNANKNITSVSQLTQYALENAGYDKILLQNMSDARLLATDVQQKLVDRGIISVRSSDAL